MRRVGLFISLAGSVWFGGGTAYAQSDCTGTITAFLRERVPVFDSAGTEIGRMESKVFGKGLAVSSCNSKGYLGIEHKGQSIFLRRVDVRFDGPSRCRMSAESLRTERMAGSKPGARAGAGSTNVCIPVKK